MTTLTFQPIPTKNEIIPIHTSDRFTFNKCRRRWDWSSPMRQNLVANVEQHGVVFPLWFGGGIHYALKEMYDPTFQRDPVEAFLTWYQLNWEGGICDEDFLDFTYDRKPELTAPPYDLGPNMYRIRGLRTMHYDPDPDEFEKHRELGENMLTYYKEYAAKNDNFEVLAAEHTFSVPIVHPVTGEPLIWKDWRDDGKEKPVHLRGTQDAIIRDGETGRLGILEHKSAIDITEDYFAKLENDEQCTAYLSALELETGEVASFVLYNAVRKAFPKPPTVLKNGLPSINRKEESTTYDMFMRYLETSGQMIIAQTNEKYLAYMDYLQAIAEDQFIVRRKVRRNKFEIAAYRTHAYNQAMDMIDSPRIYPNKSNDFGCLRCVFRGPCIAKDDGSDHVMMLEDGFIRNWGR